MCVGGVDFRNECVARCTSSILDNRFRRGRCAELQPQVKEEAYPCQCTLAWYPICVEQMFTYRNSCMAFCDNQYTFVEGECSDYVDLGVQ